MISLLQSEPALTGGIAAGLLSLGLALLLTPGQIAAVTPLVPVVAAVFIRQQVYSKPSVATLLSGPPTGPPKL